jgi:multicomponent Na+:H+ antiporter subunit D
MGYILFGIGSLTEQGMVGAIMHVVYHAIVKALLFMVVGIIITTIQERQIEKLSGLAKVLPVTTVCAAIGALGISGMPPLGIFNSEWMIFAGGFDSGYSPLLTILTLVGSLFTVVYALRFFGKIFLGKLAPGIELKASPRALTIPTVAVTIFLIVEGLLPAPLLSWAIQGLAVVFGGTS